MIRMFLGKPGGGKSFGALRDIVDEIVNGNRTIVTNLALDVGALSAWIQLNHPEADFDPVKRIRLLDDTETKRFWMYRGPRKVVEEATANPAIEGHFGVVPKHMFSVLYVIDECHIHFDARCWKENGLQLTFYNSQHRKYNDEVIFVTQFLDLVDKRVKGFAQDYVYFVNNGLQRFMTHFRLPSYFTVKTYSRAQADGPRKDSPQASTRYQLDVTLASCYDTSAGVGIPGRKKHEANRIKGLPIYWIIVPIVALGFVLVKAPDVATKGIMGVLDTGQPVRSATEKPSAGGGQGQDRLGAVPLPTGSTAPAPASPGVHQPQTPEAPPVPVFVRSVAILGKKAIVTLTDGRTFTRGTGLLAITDDYVFTKDGRSYQRVGVLPSPPSGGAGGT